MVFSIGILRLATQWVKLTKLCVFSVSFCAVARGAELTQNDFDVNDLTVVYPLRGQFERDTGKKLVYLSEGNQLISQRQFDQILSTFKKEFALDFRRGSQSSLMKTLDKWAVVAFRIDHCFRRHVDQSCRPQVRVVAQAVSGNEKKATDFSMHFFYEPSESTLELVTEMVRIRKDYASNKNATLGKPLGIHPILKAKGGMTSKFAQALKKEFLFKFLSPRNLKEIAVSFIEPERLQPWVFFRAKMSDLSEPLDNSIFTFDPQNSPNRCGVKAGRLICKKDLKTGKIVDSDEKRERLEESNFRLGMTRSGKPYLDDFLTLIQKAEDPRQYKVVANQLAYWDGVFNRLDNPRLSGPGDTNCASCHRVTPDRVRLRGILNFNMKTGKNAYRPEKRRYCTHGNGIDHFKTGMRTFTVRMLGYMHEEPIIGQRVVNETIEVCNSLKDKLR